MTNPACRGCGATLNQTFVDLGETPLANSYPGAADLDRPAEMHANIASGAPLGDFQLFQQVLETQLRRRLVHDQAHGPIRRMRTQENDTALKSRIPHARHGDQQLATEIQFRFSRFHTKLSVPFCPRCKSRAENLKSGLAEK